MINCDRKGSLLVFDFDLSRDGRSSGLHVDFFVERDVFFDFGHLGAFTLRRGRLRKIEREVMSTSGSSLLAQNIEKSRGIEMVHEGSSRAHGWKAGKLRKRIRHHWIRCGNGSRDEVWDRGRGERFADRTRWRACLCFLAS